MGLDLLWGDDLVELCNLMIQLLRLLVIFPAIGDITGKHILLQPLLVSPIVDQLEIRLSSGSPEATAPIVVVAGYTLVQVIVHIDYLYPLVLVARRQPDVPVDVHLVLLGLGLDVGVTRDGLLIPVYARGRLRGLLIGLDLGHLADEGHVA